MKTIAHISDLHFSTEDSTIAEALVKDLQKFNPAVVINSGDFTQRARSSQFKAAASYLKRLPKPQINVPGNHDIPLFDLFRRFFSPLTRFRKFISDERFPRYMDDNLIVLGINTARSLTWKSGRISKEQVDEMEQILLNLPQSHFKIVVTHHPFIPPPGEENIGVKLVGRAKKALAVIERSNVDLLLAGHLHEGYTGDIRTFYPSSKRSIVVAQAGTAISKRVRHDPNGYNLIRIGEDIIDIEVRRWLATKSVFSKAERIVFTKKDNKWVSETAKTGVVL
ncbi:MAG: metallophosphoesterase [Balneolaceae bacterium]